MRKLIPLFLLLVFCASYASDPPRTKLTGVEVTRSLVLPDCDSDYSAKEPGELCRVPSTGLVKRWDGSAWVAIGGGGGDMEKSTYDTDDDGTVEASDATFHLVHQAITADYIVGDPDSDGTYEVFDNRGAEVHADSDAGAAIDWAIDAVSPDGGTVLLRSGTTFTYSSTMPTFEPGNVAWVRVVGYGATIKVSDDAWSAFYWDKNADGDVFKWIWLEGFSVDASAMTGGHSGVITGNWNPLNQITPNAVSWEHLRIKNIHTYGILTDPTLGTHSGSVRLKAYAAGWSGSPYIDDVVVSGVYQEGGNFGVNISGTDHGGGSWVGRVVVENCYIDMRDGDEVQETGFSSTGVQIGEKAIVYDAVMRDLSVYAPGDNCFELNNALHGTADGLHCYNPQNVAFTLANHIVLDHPDMQSVHVKNLQVVVTDAPDDGVIPVGITVDGGSNAATDHDPLGNIVVEDLSYTIDLQEALTSDSYGPVLLKTETDPALKRLSVRNVSAVLDGLELVSTSNHWVNFFSVQGYPWDWDGDGTDEPTRMSISDVNIFLRAKDGGSGTVTYYVFGGTSPLDIDIADVDVFVDTMDGSLADVRGFVRGNPSSLDAVESSVHIRGLHIDYEGTISGDKRVLHIPANVNLSRCDVEDTWERNGDIFVDAANASNVVATTIIGNTAGSFTSTITGLGVDSYGPFAYETKASGDDGLFFLIGNRGLEQWQFTQTAVGNLYLSIYAWYDPSDSKWKVPPSRGGSQFAERIGFSSGGYWGHYIAPNVSRSAGDEITDWRPAFIINMKDWDGNGVRDDVGVGIRTADVDAPLTVKGDVSKDEVIRVMDSSGAVVSRMDCDGTISLDGSLQLGDADSAANSFCETRLSADTLLRDADCDDTHDATEVCDAADGDDPDCDGTAEAKVSTDGTLSFDGKLQIGDADATTNAFCETRLSGDVILLDADCDGTQDSGEICEAAGGVDTDCDGTEEREITYTWIKYNMSSGTSEGMVPHMGSYVYLPNGFRLLYAKCWSTESVDAGTLTFKVRWYSSPGGSYTEVSPTMQLDSSAGAYDTDEITSCTSNCTGSGKYMRLIITSDASYQDSGADYTADQECIVVISEEQR